MGSPKTLIYTTVLILWSIIRNLSASGTTFMFKVPISELFLFSYLNLNITLRTSVKKFFDLHKTRIFL